MFNSTNTTDPRIKQLLRYLLLWILKNLKKIKNPNLKNKVFWGFSAILMSRKICLSTVLLFIVRFWQTLFCFSYFDEKKVLKVSNLHFDIKPRYP